MTRNVYITISIQQQKRRLFFTAAYIRLRIGIVYIHINQEEKEKKNPQHIPLNVKHRKFSACHESLMISYKVGVSLITISHAYKTSRQNSFVTFFFLFLLHSLIHEFPLNFLHIFGENFHIYGIYAIVTS